MKLFLINEVDYVYANNKKEAFEYYTLDIDDSIEMNEIKEVPIDTTFNVEEDEGFIKKTAIDLINQYNIDPPMIIASKYV